MSFFWFFLIALLNNPTFSIKWSAAKNIKGCSFGISFINAVLKMAGAVFLLDGSKTILNFLILCFLRCCFTCFRYFAFVLIIGASKIEALTLSKVLPNRVQLPKSINCLA